MLARDAYDEFAKAPYWPVLALRDRMNHDKLVEWINSADIPVSRRRLYLTMLGACGRKDDMPLLEEMIKSKDRKTKGALDALVASYLTLKGPKGMPLVEELFLKNQDAEYTDTYATIMALRFHGTEEKIIPRDRLLGGMRLMLDRPQLADLVIPDLARWEDWSVMDRLVELFKNSDEESSWVRVPVINYLRACPQPEAKAKIEELAKIDPETIKRANSFFPLGGAGAAAADKSDANKSDAEKSGSEKPATAATGEEDKKPAATGEAKTGEAKTGKSTGEKKTAAPTQSSAVPRPGTERVELSAAKSAVLAGHLSKDAGLEPGPPAKTLPAVGGLAAAGVVLAGAFWALLKGGQRVTG